MSSDLEGQDPRAQEKGTAVWRVSPVAFVVHGYDVHSDEVLLVGVQTRDLHTHGGEHASGRKPPPKTSVINTVLMMLNGVTGSDVKT